jgi:hypothetical protein
MQDDKEKEKGERRRRREEGRTLNSEGRTGKTSAFGVSFSRLRASASLR